MEKHSQKNIEILQEPFSTKKEIVQNSQNDRIIAVIELGFQDIIWNSNGIEYINEIACSKIAGCNQGFLEDICYKFVGCNIEKQTLLVEVDASIMALKEELDVSGDRA